MKTENTGERKTGIAAKLASGKGVIFRSKAEMTDNRELTVFGCRKIIKYDPSVTVLLLYDKTLTVRGKNLTCISYYAGAVGIEGEIDGLDYSPLTEGGDRVR